MANVVDLSKGWQALEIKGRGVIVAAEMGLVFVDYVAIENGDLVSTYPSVPDGESSPASTKPGPSTVSAVNIKAFLEETARKNLTGGGDYGVLGPVIEKLRQSLKCVDKDSTTETLLGNLLALGDHGRFGSAAAIVGMAKERLDEFVQLLDDPKVEVLEAFVDRCIVGGA